MEMFLGLLKMGGALLIVLGAIATTTYLAKRFLYSRLGLKNSPIQVLATSYLGAKKEIALIEVGERFLLVGVTPNQISLLTEMDKFPLNPSQSFRIKEAV
ncbi:MAG: flagellar biosynthetic protein FliO [Nitrospirae bacterium]|nr:flagellar biosynthetic protein FliO [Candidatus Troglogloeales bacterium]MBI3597947.1 flagellar biosynthetic protein FliO [Candidatus Troglogloeales bacterium]